MFSSSVYNVFLVLKAFPDVYTERGRAIDQEEREARLNTPIFVCQLSFPGVPTVLHFFEPRYEPFFLQPECIANGRFQVPFDAAALSRVSDSTVRHDHATQRFNEYDDSRLRDNVADQESSNASRW